MKLVLATRNPGKVRELKELFKDIDVELVTIDEFESIPEVIEDGKSFRENALKKAKVIADSTGEFAIADDSGLEVEYLNGRPGIYSSRYAREGAADKENNEKLLSEMEGVCASERGASFCCVIALIGPGIEKTFKGTCCGSIAFEPKGEKGFGYDSRSFTSRLLIRLWQNLILKKRIVSVIGQRLSIGAWRSLVAHLLWEQGVGGSNPLAPTTVALTSYLELNRTLPYHTTTAHLLIT